MNAADGSTAVRRGIIGTFVSRPVLSAMIALATVLIGVIAFVRLPLRFMPAGLSSNQLRVWIPVPGERSPQEVQDKVIEPLVAMLRTIPGLQQLDSRAGDGGGYVGVELDEGMDPSLAAAEVRDRVQRAMPQWPDGVDRYFTWKEDGSSAPLAFVQLLTPTRDPQWNWLLDQVVRTRFEAVDGVGRVDLWGLMRESVRIWFDRDKLQAAHVDFRTVLQKLQGDNFAMPLGELEIAHGQQSYLVRVDSKFHSTSTIEKLPIRPGVVLGDVASIERVPEVRDELSRFDQKYTCTAMIRAAAEANPVLASDGLRLAVAELQRDPRLTGLSVRFLFDQGQFIREGLGNLVSTAIQGGLLALLVLWLFLRNLAMTVVIATAIPMTLLVTGAQLFFAGSSLDICTMAGMTLAVGMVVDNSVVVLENIRRLREHGLGVVDACIQGAREVGLAVTVSTLTTVVVFLPMAFLGNRSTQVLMGAVGVPLSVALLASLLVALLLMPSGLAALGGGGRLAAAGFGRYSPLSWLLRLNGALLRLGLRHRILACLCGLALLATALIPIFVFGFEMRGTNMDPFRRGDLTVHYGCPRGTDLPAAEQIFLQFERYVLAHAGDWGVAHVGGRFGREHGRVDLHLQERLPVAAMEALRQRVLRDWPQVPGIRLQLGERGGQSMGGRNTDAENDERNFVVRLWGRDSEFLIAKALQAQALLAALPIVDNVEVPAIEHNQEVVVALDRPRLQDLGVPPEAVLGTMASGLQGRELGRFEESDREVRMVAQFDATLKPSLLDLKDTQVFARGGSYQRLDDLGSIGFQKAVTSIESQDNRVNVVIVGHRRAGVSSRDMSQQLRASMAMLPLPSGYSWSEESVQRQTGQEITELLQSVALSVVLVFLLMGVLLESVLLPFSILVTIPFALFGACWSLWLFHGSIDPMAMIGMLILCGVVVNNGIVLLDHIARLRRSGMSRHDAIFEGTAVRMRPIFMTAATTLVGLLPMALFGDDGEGISYVGLSIAVAGGLAFCTVFTAVTVPLAYTFADDLRRWLGSVVTAARHGHRVDE